MSVDRETATIALGKLGTTVTDLSTAMTICIDFLTTMGYSDVALAFMTRIDAIGVAAPSGTNAALVKSTYGQSVVQAAQAPVVYTGYGRTDRKYYT